MPLQDFIAPITGTAGAIFGLLNEKHEDKRQLEQQEKLQQLQMRGQQSMGKFNQKLGQEMWDYTNYENQMKHIKAAGLNPGLLYGKGGGGGVTASVAPGNITGAEAPKGSGKEIQEMAGMGMQIGLQAEALKSQIEVNKSVANLNNTEAKKKAGIDTTVGETQVKSLTQGIENAKAQKLLTEAETNLKNIETTYGSDTLYYREGYIHYQMMEALSKARSAVVEANLSENTYNDKKNTIEQTAIKAVLDNELTKNNIQLTKEQINKISNEIQQNWTKIDIEKFKAIIDKNRPTISQISGQMINSIFNKVSDLLKIPQEYKTPLKP